MDFVTRVSLLPSYLLFKEHDMAFMFCSEEYTDGRIRAVALDLATIVWLKLGKKTTITDVWRTQKDHASYQTDGKFTVSGHVDIPCRSIDFRVWNLTDDDCIILQNYHTTTHRQARFHSLLRHSVGRGLHYHVQVPRRAGYDYKYFDESIVANALARLKQEKWG